MTVKIFFDMDGVLVNFSAGVADALNAAIASGDTSHRKLRRLIEYDGPERTEITVPFLEALVTKKDLKQERNQWEKRVGQALFHIVGTGGHEYWSSLAPNPGYLQMLEVANGLVGLNNLYICTAPVQDNTGGCESGKRAWVNDNTIVPANQVFVTENKGSIAAQFPEDTCILIDDRIKYCSMWEESGGIAIRHAPPANMSRVEKTISELKYIVDTYSEKNR